MACSDPASSYYDGLLEGDLDGTELRSSLHDLIDSHQALPYYSPTEPDTHGAVDQLDMDPQDPSRVRLFYTDWSVSRENWGEYNREHLWPQSQGLDIEPAKSDLHNLFAADSGVNGDRGNLPFDDCPDCPTHPDCEVRFDTLGWEPPHDRKGDVARALFYMDVRYQGDAEGEPDLRLEESPDASCETCMPMMSTLLRWHHVDPVGEDESSRNDGVFGIQQNRNPFVDHPEWVCRIWDCEGLPVPLPAWINEIHYDNDGADEGEGVEIAGVSGQSLDGWTLVFYNGSTGLSYDAIALSGDLESPQWFDKLGLQNGSPDGIALVEPNGEVVQFLSYEGSFTALDGAAIGTSAVDIGVEETSSNSVGHSLQLVGIGFGHPDFEWSSAMEASPGQVNGAQQMLRDSLE